MSLRAAVAALCLLASPALAETPQTTVTDDPPLTAEEFDSLTRGKTMDTHDAISGLYGVETFLSGRRVVWKDADGCMNGTWEQVGQQICFIYDGKPDDPVCWTYHDRGSWIEGFFRGDRQAVPIMLYPGGVPVSCGEYLGA